MKRNLLLISLIFCSCASLFAQPPSFGGRGRGKAGPSITGRIAGQVIDSLTSEPVAYATVILFDPSGEKQIDGVVTDDEGKFRLTKVKTGKHRIQVSFLGYEDKLVSEIETTPAKPDIDLGTVFVLQGGVNLDEVTVTGEAAIFENKIDKLVYNAEKDITNSGGDAADVLRKVPLLSVDLEGNVSLRGSQNIQVLVNGRPSTLFSTNLADALKTIPADQIKNVEVITTPTARYDGEGTAGIINIITKKKSAEGVTGSINTSIGTRQNNATASLNVVKGRFGVNGNASSFWSWKRNGSLEFYREDERAGGETNVLQQSGPNSSQVLGFNGSVGAFHDFNAYNNLSSSIRFNGFGNRREGNIIGSNGLLTSSNITTFDRLNENESLRSGFDWTTDFRRTFANQPEREFIAAFQVSGTISDQENTTLQLSNNPLFENDVINNNDGLNLEYTGQVDYIHPFGKGNKLETGAKAVIRRIDSDYETLSRDDPSLPYLIVPATTDDFAYEQDVWAGFLSFNLKLSEKFGAVVGARYEHTTIRGSFASNEIEPFQNDYDNLLPSIIFNYKLKGFSNLKLSYARRIQRPSLFFINPFVAINDPTNITFGNPNLDPELTDQYELAYNTFFKGISVNMAFFYRRTTDIIESFLVVNEELDRSETTYLNIGTNNSFGVNFFGSATIAKIWTIRGGLNVFTYDAASSIDSINLSRNNVVWTGNLNSSIKLPKDWQIEMFGFYRSPRQTLQGENPAFSIFGMGLRKEFSKKLSLGLRAIEPFSENKSFPSELVGDGFFQRSNFSIPFRSIGVSLRYSFGKIDFRQQRRSRSRIRNDDLKGGGNDNF